VFERHLNSTFMRGQVQTYKIIDTTPRAFRLLMQLMYYQDLNLQQLDRVWVANNEKREVGKFEMENED